jgi:dihydropteroate synthase
MAIINCNDDSFYPASRALAGAAVEKALAAAEAGAAIIDFGGESTRPGGSYIAADEELERVIPVIRAFRERSDAAVSVDTRKAAVAKAALEAGADIINDISALEDDPDMGRICAEAGAAVILMHKRGRAEEKWKSPGYVDVAAEVGQYLAAAALGAQRAGISRNRIIIDPGIGFGKTTGENLEILARLPVLAEIAGKDYPLLIGLSRKTFIGELTGRDAAPRNVAGRLPGTLGANAAALLRGADIIRVHDPAEHLDLVKVLYEIRRRM